MTRGQLNGLRLALLMTVTVMRASSTDCINAVAVVRESASDSNQQYDQRSQQQHAIFAVTVMRASSTDCVNAVYTVVCGKRKCIRLKSTLPVTKYHIAIFERKKKEEEKKSVTIFRKTTKNTGEKKKKKNSRAISKQ